MLYLQAAAKSNRPGKEYIKSKGKIYGRDPTKVTPYQEKVNDAALQLVLDDPNLLLSKQKLIDLAQAKVNEQQEFKKGKSRSKRYQSTTTAPKKVKTTESIRMKHISEVV